VNGLGLHTNAARAGAATGAGAATWARAITPRDRRAGGDTVAAATGTEGTRKVGVDATAFTTGRTRGRRLVSVDAVRCAAVREALAEGPTADDEGEDAEPSAGALSAAATPAPASAAPTPTLSKPAPNHAYG